MRSFKLCLLVSLSLLHLSLSKSVFRTLETDPCINPSGTQTLLFEVGDFNGDGNADFIVRPKTAPNGCDGQTKLMISNGHGDFTKYVLDCSLNFKGQDTILTVADYNGDGKDDILRREKGDVTETAEILSYKGAGKFNRIPLPETFKLRNDLTNILMGDFNGDGKADFVRQEKGAWDDDNKDLAQVFLSTGRCFPFTKYDIPYEQPVALPGDLTTIFVGDFNGDGKDDFIRQEMLGWDWDELNTADVFLSNGKGKFTSVDIPESYKLKGSITKLSIGDFNGDGKTDFLRQIKSQKQATGAWS